MTRKIFPHLSQFKVGQHNVEHVILKKARKEGNIIFGGQAIKRKLGLNARPTKDFDVFTKTPKGSAIRTEKALDKQFRADIFFTKKGTNPSTYKVKFKGLDNVPNNLDDIAVADFTKTPKPEPKTFISRGVMFRTLDEERKAKERLVKKGEFAFRREKDLEDLRRIRRFSRIKNAQ